MLMTPNAEQQRLNETNVRRLCRQHDAPDYSKDAFHEYVIDGNKAAVNPQPTDTKAAAHYVVEVPAHNSRTVRLRFARSVSPLPKEREQQSAVSGDSKRIQLL